MQNLRMCFAFAWAHLSLTCSVHVVMSQNIAFCVNLKDERYVVMMSNHALIITNLLLLKALESKVF